MKIFIFLTLSYFIQNVSAQPVVKSMLRLPDTGVNKSYTDTFGEDADFTINQPYFINNGNGTVTDSVTGLIWQQTDGGEMTIENAIIYCNNLILAGYSDWRLPSAQEAFSILNHQYTNPAMDENVFTTTLAQYWWTSESQVNDSNKIWATNSGGGIGNHPKTETLSAGGPKRFHVRAVRDKTTPPVIPNHFTDNENGTITDNLTKLIWQKVPNADTLSWEQALSYADTLSLAGMSDWRLPNIKELQSINDENLINPSLNPNFFDVGNSKKYWSSTTLPNQTTKAWYLNTQYGITTYDTKTVKHSVICVNGNQISTGLNGYLSENYTVFPNPFTSRINLKYKTGNEKFELINCLGVIIYSGKNIEQQDFTSLPNGFYLLKVIDKSASLIKLLKK
ncbi:MAG: DUF1566 domain-containing protein [Saprospiraceae bacterium]|jgi:hypothetical protein|nr:DUF1566 domain-containing protein [Saprospiraceae bacterium]